MVLLCTSTARMRFIRERLSTTCRPLASGVAAPHRPVFPPWHAARARFVAGADYRGDFGGRFRLHDRERLAVVALAPVRRVLRNLILRADQPRRAHDDPYPLQHVAHATALAPAE